MNKKIVEYKVVYGMDSDQVTSRVMTQIRLGFQPYGSLQATSFGLNQAMVKYDS